MATNPAPEPRAPLSPAGLRPLCAGLFLISALVGSGASRAQSTRPVLRPVQVVVDLKQEVELDAAWTLVATPQGEGAEPLRQPMQGTQPVTLSLPVGSHWDLSGELAGFWVQRQPLAVASPPAGQPAQKQQVRLELWPLGTVRGSLRHAETTAKKEPLPKQVVLRTISTPAVLRRPASPAGSKLCPVARDGSWSCEVPAGTLDITLLAEGFTPAYYWGLEVPPLGERELPPLVLHKGASVAGWVAIDGGKIDPETCVARLSPAANCAPNLGEALRLSSTAVEQKVGAEGFLHFKDLAPGHYALEVRQPGYATAFVDLVQVVQGQESFLQEPLILTRPLELRLEIHPSLDLDGHPWRIRGYSLTGAAANAGQPRIVFDGTADEQGLAALKELSPGEIYVAISDQLGNRLFNNNTQPWLIDTSQVRRIEIPQVQITGSLHLGEEPLAASLYFGGRSGGNRVQLQSDEKGRFAGVLPREGPWRVQVIAQEPQLDTMAEAEVHAGESGEAFVALELPDNRLRGKLMDATGLPVSHGQIVVTGKSIVLFQHRATDEHGTFEFRALPAGTVSLMGDNRENGCQAGPLMVTMPEAGAVGPIELRCRKKKVIAGTVVSTRGPGVGVQVLVRGLPPQRGGGEAITGNDGTFSMEVPADLEQAIVSLQATGYGFQQRPVKLGAEPLRLTLREGTGELKLRLPNFADLRQQELQISLFQEGTEVPLALLTKRSSPATEPGSSSLEISQLAPGHYAACLRKQAATPFSAPEAVDPSQCVSGRLAAGRQLTLQLDRENSEDSEDSEDSESSED